MEPDNIPSLLKTLGASVENKIAEAMKGRDDKEDADRRRSRGDNEHPMPRFRSENGMDYMEPDWEELDRKANLIIVRYTAISAATNVLPFGLDVVAVTATFSKMTTELAGVYQVIVSNKRARQMGWAIATTTGTVLGAAYAGTRIAKLIPGGYFFGVLVQAPIVTAVAWAAGDALKGYFKQARMGEEPTLGALSESFARTLHLKLKKVKNKNKAEVAETPAETKKSSAAAGALQEGRAAAEPQKSVGDIVEKIASLHELMRIGAITQADFERKKAELLSEL